MKTNNPLNYFRPIALKDPVEEVISQIKDLINSEILKPGDRLPSEKKLEEKFKISRGYIRKAFKRLETYGILKIVPQSGAYVAGIGIHALEGLLSNVLQLKTKEWEAIYDIRYILEIYAVELVASNATDNEIKGLEEIYQEFCRQIESGIVSFDEDLVFHLKLAEYSKNSILQSLITLLASEVMHFFKEFEQDIGKKRVVERMIMAREEHEKILKTIKERNPVKASQAMKEHFKKAKEYRKKVINKIIVNKEKYVEVPWEE